MPETHDLEKRLAKLEKEGPSKIFLQFLIYPGILLAVGWWLNHTLNDQKLEVQKIQVLQTLLPSLFSENHSRALATELIVAKVEPDMAKDLNKITADYWKDKLQSAIKNGQIDSVNNIISAAKSVGGAAADQIIQSTTSPSTASAISSLQLAKQYEQQGFEALINEDFATALTAFQQSENAYHGYHQVYEIARLLRAHKSEFSDIGARKKLIRQIVTDDFRGAPPDLLAKLKDLST